MVFNLPDASVFAESVNFYSAEFEDILAKVVLCYRMMINGGVAVSNNEEKIRDLLYSQYLNNNDVRNRIGLNFNIVCEPAEYSEDGECTGYVDLRVFSRNSLTDTSAYFIIECKRLDNQNLKGETGLNAKYIKDGIMRFVNKQYSTNKHLNGMIGFVVESMNITDNIDNINNLLKNKYACSNTLTKLTVTDFIQDFDYQYYSEHKITEKQKKVKLYHLMFDFSKNMQA